MLSSWLSLDVISPQEAILRVVLALAFGFVLGQERDQKNKPIDFRAFMIVAVTTCLVAILGQELYHDYEQADNVAVVDLSRIIAGTLAGIGFLGAGAIIKVEDRKVVGSATGASIWAAGGIGLCVGFGMYFLAFIGFVAMALILIGGGYYMRVFNDENDTEKDKDKEQDDESDKYK